MSLRTWSHRACTIALVILLVGCGGGSTTAGSGSAGSGGTSSTGTSGSTGGSSSTPVVTGVSTPKSVSVVTAN
jgi:hypothetical protein